ncbi:hypothetical protein VOI54_00685 [Tamlana sp. 2201CG12-4]|uniref:hypothetical protein n=1 Tax=Tamlana sp. 2201CG12-4 TaxID=3112582 RepID=UPI002DB989DE|nr:hypothetical protein [Tamlana sp. 2201CG12-4]MEC3905523.1 hypothetical protein [Tamlana sp. 2201CG12-4]
MDNLDFKTLEQIHHFRKFEHVNNVDVYDKFKNWVIGEFDLYLKNDESKELKVYFPGGRFTILTLDDQGTTKIEINISGKSRKACWQVMNQLEKIYAHVSYFLQSETRQCISL